MRARRDSAIVLMYHSIVATDRDPFWVRVQPDHFAAHLEQLEHVADVVPLAEILDHVPGRRVAITFDDGYADNLETAMPLLEAAGLPATVFVTSKIIATDGKFWWDQLEHLLFDGTESPPRLALDLGDQRMELAFATPHERALALEGIQGRLRPLGAAEIGGVIDQVERQVGPMASDFTPTRRLDLEGLRALAQSSVIEIGGHTRTHPLLASRDLDVQRAEIEGGKRELEHALGIDITSFAYPFGSPDSYSRATARAVRDAGFDRACTTRSKRNNRRTDPFQIPRVAVRDWPAAVFRERVESALRRGKG